MGIGFSGGNKLEAHLAGIAKKLADGKILRVGFLETETYPDGTNVAQVAYWNEYGTSKMPPRPFFRSMIADKSPGWGVALGKSLKATDYDVIKSLRLVGTGIAGQLTQSVVDFKTPGNAPSTIARKGFDKPLVDTGQMQRSPNFDLEGEQ